MKYILRDVRYYVIDADNPAEAANIYEDAREDYNEHKFEVETDEDYEITELGSLH